MPGTGKTESMGAEDVSADSQCACERRSDTLSVWIASCQLAGQVHLKLLQFEAVFQCGGTCSEFVSLNRHLGKGKRLVNIG